MGNKDMKISELIRDLRHAASIVGSLPERPGYNGSILSIDDLDAELVEQTLDRAVEMLLKLICIGVINSIGDIYPQPPVAGTKIFIMSDE